MNLSAPSVRHSCNLFGISRTALISIIWLTRHTSCHHQFKVLKASVYPSSTQRLCFSPDVLLLYKTLFDMTIAYRVISRQKFLEFSVPARPIYEGAAPCPHWLAPCPIYTRHAQIKKKKKFNLKKRINLFFIFTKCNCGFCVFRQPMQKCL